jgi:hypothetical protein
MVNGNLPKKIQVAYGGGGIAIVEALQLLMQYIVKNSGCKTPARSQGTGHSIRKPIKIRS